MRHNDTTIFRYVHCAPLSVNTAIFSGVSDFLVSHENGK